MHDEPKSRPGCGCLKFAGLGCTVLLVLMGLLAVVVGLNFNTIRNSEWVQDLMSGARGVQQEFGNLLTLRAQLLQDYPAENLQVNMESQYTNGISTNTLDLAFENPTFVPESTDAWEATAKGVARRVSEIHPDILHYQEIQITFATKIGTGFTISSSESFLFSVDEFVVPEPVTAPEASPTSTTPTTPTTPTTEPATTP